MRRRLTRRSIRFAFLAVLVTCTALVAFGAVTDQSTARMAGVSEAPETDNYTVVTETARVGAIVAFAPNGSVAYHNDSHTKYYDVDPVEGESMTVEYTATDTLFTESPRCRSPPCAINYVERANLSTGEVEVLYERYDYRETVGEWHDADRIDENRVAIADIVADRVFVVDTETEIVEWAWDAQSEFPVEGGGPYPGNWVHLNDVEALPDGRIVVSLRNQDQAVFLNRSTGMQEDWTLGAEDDHSILYEQHNPDYIPESRGGPAVVVSDSENGRVQEFQRVDGEWERTWQWADERLQWPRDADRLPDGNTLVVDTGGQRVIEVNPEGEVVWQVEMEHPYDAERLETGDESAGGRSARALGLESRIAPPDDQGDDGRQYDIGPVRPLVDEVRDVVPDRFVNMAVYRSPTWVDPSDLLPALLVLVTGVAWGACELRWFVLDRNVAFRSPVYRDD